MNKPHLQVCKDCQGRKKVLGLGMIERDCFTCKGIGYTESIPLIDIPVPAIPQPLRPKQLKKTKVKPLASRPDIQI